jgi:hypothetical protein
MIIAPCMPTTATRASPRAAAVRLDHGLLSARIVTALPSQHLPVNYGARLDPGSHRALDAEDCHCEPAVCYSAAARSGSLRRRRLGERHLQSHWDRPVAAGRECRRRHGWNRGLCGCGWNVPFRWACKSHGTETELMVFRHWRRWLHDRPLRQWHV